MARKEPEKAKSFVVEQPNPNHVPCAADPACRLAGRMFLLGMKANERVCVEHYYQALSRGEEHAEAPMQRAA